MMTSAFANPVDSLSENLWPQLFPAHVSEDTECDFRC